MVQIHTVRESGNIFTFYGKCNNTRRFKWLCQGRGDWFYRYICVAVIVVFIASHPINVSSIIFPPLILAPSGYPVEKMTGPFTRNIFWIPLYPLTRKIDRWFFYKNRFYQSGLERRWWKLAKRELILNPLDKLGTLKTVNKPSPVIVIKMKDI